jgi:hypothetical protein
MGAYFGITSGIAPNLPAHTNSWTYNSCDKRTSPSPTVTTDSIGIKLANTMELSTHMACISWRRYTVQVLLSLLAVYTSNFLPQPHHPTLLFWTCSPYLGMWIWLITQWVDVLGPPRSEIVASQPYCIATTFILLYLHEGATTIGKSATE